MSTSLNFAIKDEYDRFISLWKQLVEISTLIYWESFRPLLSDYLFFPVSTKIHPRSHRNTTRTAKPAGVLSPRLHAAGLPASR